FGNNFHSEWEQFDDETQITYYTGPDFQDLIMESTDLDMNDVINLLDYYTHKVKSKCLPKDETDAAAPQFNMKFTRDSNREVIRVECPDMDFVASKSYYKIILKMRIR
ncbi:MAG TPA: hypothetical protein VFX48_05525, partial [Saprospiraceae bacterium]|nr:hypothetical protein [Saprospiraceae bacterium]